MKQFLRYTALAFLLCLPPLRCCIAADPTNAQPLSPATTTGSFPNFSAGASSTAYGLFGNTADTAHLPGMNNDWHCIFTATGSGSLVATGSNFAIGGIAIPTGTTSFSITGGTTAIGSSTLSGTVFIVTAGPPILSASNYSRTSYGYNGTNAVVQAGPQGPRLSASPGGLLWCSGTDDYATFQALLNTATNSLSCLTVYIDSDFALSNAPVLHGNTRLIGVGGHMWHMEPGANEPGLISVLTGATISSSNIVTQNLWIDCNRPEMSNPRCEGSGAMQSGTCHQWVFGAWIGSAEYCDLDLTLVNPCTFSFVYSNLYDSRVKLRNIWTDQEAPYLMATNDFNDDGAHGWGPDNNIVFHDCDLMGDDNQMPFCPVEQTPEGICIDVLTGSNSYDARRGHGGPMTNITFDHTFLRNASNALRLGGQTVASGTANWENVIDNIHILNTTGTTWYPGAVCTAGGYLGTVQVDNWAVASGTAGQNGNCLVFSDFQSFFGINSTNAPATYVSLSNIRSDAPVYVYADSGYNDPGTYDLGGSYFNDTRRLREGCVAAYTFNTDTSGSTAYDWSGHGASLSNANGVTFTSGTAWGNAATFNSGSSQYLYLSGTACPNIASMPEWTIAGWFNQSSNSGNFPGIFVLMDGTNRQLLVGLNGGASSLDAYCDRTEENLYADYGPNSFFGNGHWIFWVIRKRATDGKVQFVAGGPNGWNYSGPWTNTLAGITGADPEIILGYNPENGGYFNGQIDNFEIWKRCLTDREIRLLWNPGSDGVPNLTPSGLSGWFWGGRQWPFNY